MKPLHVNLAATPYRDYRPLYAVVVVASVLIAFLMLNNIDTYYRYTRETRTTRDRIAGLEKQIGDERRRGEAAVAQTRRMDLVTLGKQTKFINAQLAERAFSWGELLDRLEDVVPANVRITSIAPSFADNGLVHLNMACESKSDTGMTTAITHFQQSPYFANPFPTAEDFNGTTYHFGMGVDYRPSIPRVVAK